MWASAPTHLAIEFRRGGALPRPSVDAHISPVWMGSTSAERVAVGRRRDSAKARCVFHNARLAWLKYSGFGCRQSAERIPKSLVLTAFFGYFLSLVTESTSRSAFVGTRDAVRHPLSQLRWQLPLRRGRLWITDRHGQCAHWLCNDSPPKFCPVFCGIRAFLRKGVAFSHGCGILPSVT